jgi:hypothetical protein
MTHRNPRQIHLNQSFPSTPDRALPPAIPFDNGRLQGLPPKLRKLQPSLARLGVEAALVMAGPRITPCLGTLVALSIAQLDEGNLTVSLGFLTCFGGPTQQTGQLPSKSRGAGPTVLSLSPGDFLRRRTIS